MGNTSNWKGRERKVAKYFGGDRTPLSGGNSKHTRGDVIHPQLYVECKHRKRQAVVSLWRDANEKAKQEDGKIPVCCVSEKGMHGFLLVIHCNDLQAVAAVRERVNES